MLKSIKKKKLYFTNFKILHLVFITLCLLPHFDLILTPSISQESTFAQVSSLHGALHLHFFYFLAPCTCSGKAAFNLLSNQTSP